MDAVDLSVHKREELTPLAFLRKLCDKQDAGNVPHGVNVSGATPAVHFSVHNCNGRTMPRCGAVLWEGMESVWIKG